MVRTWGPSVICLCCSYFEFEYRWCIIRTTKRVITKGREFLQQLNASLDLRYIRGLISINNSLPRRQLAISTWSFSTEEWKLPNSLILFTRYIFLLSYKNSLLGTRNWHFVFSTNSGYVWWLIIKFHFNVFNYWSRLGSKWMLLSGRMRWC